MASTSACVVSSLGVGSVAAAPRASRSHRASPCSMLSSGRGVSSGVSVPLLSKTSSFRTASRRPLTIVAAKSVKEPETATAEVEDALNDVLKSVQDSWEKVDDKLAIGGLGFVALIALWAANGLIGAIDKLPLIPDFLEFVGILFSGWFVYSYLLFKPDREELLKLIDQAKSKITGQ